MIFDALLLTLCLDYISQSDSLSIIPTERRVQYSYVLDSPLPKEPTANLKVRTPPVSYIIHHILFHNVYIGKHVPRTKSEGESSPPLKRSNKYISLKLHGIDPLLCFSFILLLQNAFRPGFFIGMTFQNFYCISFVREHK